jgi:hypothetical protein
MTGYIVFNNEYNVLICKEHQHAIPAKMLTRHFLEKHELNHSVRQNIQAYASQYAITTAADLAYPSTSTRIDPIPYLKIIDGFQCQHDGCNRILGSLEMIKRSLSGRA